jgi:hypothetical protein
MSRLLFPKDRTAITWNQFPLNVQISCNSRCAVMSNESEPVVDTLFRNGTLTVIGIILSFSLTFLSQWAQNPVPWTLRELPTMALLGAGIITQGSSLVIFIRHDSLQRRVYDRASKRFLYGLGMTMSGIFLAIFIDLADLIF